MDDMNAFFTKCLSTREQRNNFHPLYTLYTPCNPVVLQGVFVLKCLLTEDVLLKIENTYRGSEMKIVTLSSLHLHSSVQEQSARGRHMVSALKSIG